MNLYIELERTTCTRRTFHFVWSNQFRQFTLRHNYPFRYIRCAERLLHLSCVFLQCFQIKWQNRYSGIRAQKIQTICIIMLIGKFIIIEPGAWIWKAIVFCTHTHQTLWRERERKTHMQNKCISVQWSSSTKTAIVSTKKKATVWSDAVCWCAYKIWPVCHTHNYAYWIFSEFQMTLTHQNVNKTKMITSPIQRVWLQMPLPFFVRTLMHSQHFTDETQIANALDDLENMIHFLDYLDIWWQSINGVKSNGWWLLVPFHYKIEPVSRLRLAFFFLLSFWYSCEYRSI